MENVAAREAAVAQREAAVAQREAAIAQLEYAFVQRVAPMALPAARIAQKEDVCAEKMDDVADDDDDWRITFERRAGRVIKMAPNALELAHVLVASSGAPLATVRLKRSAVKEALTKTWEACVPWVREHVEAGRTLKIGRGGCTQMGSKKTKCPTCLCKRGEYDKIDRPLVHVLKPGSNSGSHSTLEGFVPSLARFILIGDGEIDPDSPMGYTYALLKDGEQELADLAIAEFPGKVSKNTSGGQGGCNHGPQRYLYLQVCDNTLAAREQAEMATSSTERKRRCRVAPASDDENDDDDDEEEEDEEGDESDDERPFTCPAAGCSKCYGASAGLYQHKRQKHPELIKSRV